MCKCNIFVIFPIIFGVVNCAHILCVFPVPSLSHQFVFRVLTLELAKRGHVLVIITTDPAYPKSKPPYNITEIDTSSSYKTFSKYSATKFPYKRGVVLNSESFKTIDNYMSMVNVIDRQMNHPEIKQLIDDKKRKFDLILVESFFNYHLSFSHIFKAPVISIATLHGIPENYDAVGTISRHPIFYPSVIRQNYENLSLFEIIKQLHIEYKFMKVDNQLEEYENMRLKERFGRDFPTVRELYDNIDFLFINSNPILCNNRPLPPNAAYVGPLHLQPAKELPEDMKAYMDDSKTGVIYVSLGTNVRPSLMDADLLDVFLDVFEDLPYNILFKFDGDNLRKVPKNLKIQKWFPQRDLLMHPNIKLFVTQGGLQSEDEAIDAGVPMVFVPILGDQFYNAYKFEKLGVGVKLDILTLDAESLLAGINSVLNDINRYRENVKKLRDVFHDQPQTPLERAVWWTEYVIRHKGAKHLRSPVANTSWSEYLMLDVVITIALAGMLLLVLVVLSFKYIIRLIVSNYTKYKVKRS